MKTKHALLLFIGIFLTNACQNTVIERELNSGHQCRDLDAKTTYSVQ